MAASGASEDAEGAEAYLDRMKAFAGSLDDNTARFRHDMAKGVLPPDFLIDITLTQMGEIRVPAAQSRVVTSLASGSSSSPGSFMVTSSARAPQLRHRRRKNRR